MKSGRIRTLTGRITFICFCRFQIFKIEFLHIFFAVQYNNLTALECPYINDDEYKAVLIVQVSFSNLNQVYNRSCEHSVRIALFYQQETVYCKKYRSRYIMKFDLPSLRGRSKITFQMRILIQFRISV